MKADSLAGGLSTQLAATPTGGVNLGRPLRRAETSRGIPPPSPSVANSRVTASVDEGLIWSKLEAWKVAILSRWVNDSAWLTTFAGAMAEADVVTFDVFDTAITRSVEAPVDVFALAEQALWERFGTIFMGFAQKREQAEKQARIEAWKARDCSEVTLAEILHALVRMFPAYVPFRNAINDTEIALERAASFGVPEILTAVQSCLQAGRRVIFVSDMYHDSQFIRMLLTDAGYANGIDVLVSSETGCSKAEGGQWTVVAERIGVHPGRILHVGDDGRSDVDSPRAKGLQTLAFAKAVSNKRRGGPLTPAVMPFSCMARRAQLWRAQDNAQADRAATMRVLGQSWGAVVVGAYIRWVAERAKAIGVDRLFFCARDGWLVQRAWRASGLDAETGIPSSYLYISRRSLNLGSCAVTSSPRNLSAKALDTLVKTEGNVSVLDVLARAHLTNLSDLVADVTKELGSLQRSVAGEAQEALRTVFQRHSTAIYPILRQAQENALFYLCQEGVSEGKVGIVDIGWHGSMQTSIAQILRAAGRNPMLYGFYCGLWPAAQSNRGKAGWMEAAFGSDFVPLEAQRGLSNSVSILENLFSSLEGTTMGYKRDNGRIAPVLADASSDAKQHQAVIQQFQDAAVEMIGKTFAAGIHDGLSSEDLTLAAAKAALGRLALSPSVEEMSAIGSIEHSADFAHAVFEPMINAASPDRIGKPRIDLVQSHWAVGAALTALRCCDDPPARSAMLAAIRSQIGDYDDRTLEQFQ
jgi:predicted HAD superfamily hydrolase